MCKIIQFPIERISKKPTIKVNKLTKKELENNLGILIREGIKKEDALKILKLFYMSTTLGTYQNKLTIKLFSTYWKFFTKKVV